MKVVTFEAVDEIARVQPRGGDIYIRRLIEGDPISPDNFMLHSLRFATPLVSPRHKHNFDQVRLQLEGNFTYSREGRMKPGDVGFFPEGTPYGPQTCDAGALTLLLQFGGPSGHGYMGEDALKRAMDQLKTRGDFSEGVYSWADDEGARHNMDAYQAAWEEHFGRTMEYPRPRYERPVYIHPENFVWTPLTNSDGVYERALGEFSQRHTSLGLVRLEPEAQHRIAGRSIVFVVSGVGDLEGGATWQTHSSLYIHEDETATFRASERSEVFVIGMATAN